MTKLERAQMKRLSDGYTRACDKITDLQIALAKRDELIQAAYRQGLEDGRRIDASVYEPLS